jgi:hypothetical protein
LEDVTKRGGGGAEGQDGSGRKQYERTKSVKEIKIYSEG